MEHISKNQLTLWSFLDLNSQKKKQKFTPKEILQIKKKKNLKFSKRTTIYSWCVKTWLISGCCSQHDRLVSKKPGVATQFAWNFTCSISHCDFLAVILWSYVTHISHIICVFSSFHTFFHFHFTSVACDTAVLLRFWVFKASGQLKLRDLCHCLCLLGVKKNV